MITDGGRGEATRPGFLGVVVQAPGPVWRAGPGSAAFKVWKRSALRDWWELKPARGPALQIQSPQSERKKNPGLEGREGEGEVKGPLSLQ